MRHDHDHHYMSVIAPVPVMIVRVPWPMPRWRRILAAMTPVMHAHGRYRKDISALDGLVASDPADRTAKDRDLTKRLDAAYASGTGFDKFWLYDWSGMRGGTFQLVRKGKEP